MLNAKFLNPTLKWSTTCRKAALLILWVNLMFCSFVKTLLNSHPTPMFTCARRKMTKMPVTPTESARISVVKFQKRLRPTNWRMQI